jgi:hypothetical protein
VPKHKLLINGLIFWCYGTFHAKICGYPILAFPHQWFKSGQFPPGSVGAGFVTNAKRLLNGNIPVFTTTGIQQAIQTCPLG